MQTVRGDSGSVTEPDRNAPNPAPRHGQFFSASASSPRMQEILSSLERYAHFLLNEHISNTYHVKPEPVAMTGHSLAKRARTANPRNHSSRQQPPVSCQSCRSRKLRCNRERPCSNCVSRGIQCQQAESRRAETSAMPGPAAQPVSPAAKPSSEHQLLRRISRLEEIIALQSENWSQNAVSEQQRGIVSLEASGPTSSISSCFESLPIASGFSFPNPTPSDAQLNTYMSWLQHLSSTPRSLTSAADIRLSLEIRPLCQINNRQEPHIQSSTLSVVLPPLAEAQTLFDKYIRDVDYFYHIIYVPSLRGAIHSLYSHIPVPNQIPTGQVVLVLSVLVAATQFWTGSDSSNVEALPKEEDVIQAGSVWIATVFKLVEYCQRMNCDSLETLQGITILSAVVGSLEGASHRHRCLLNQALTMAKVLKIHTSDHPEDNGPAGQIEAEVKRRVWWYLVSTDWLLASISGSQEGTYQVNPRHMVVNIPRNLEDDDLVEDSSLVERPLSQATTMSYFLQRLRLAEIIRNFVDRSPLVTATLGAPSYGDILEADIELDRFINSLPPFFRLGNHDQGHTDNTTAANPGIAVQTYFVNAVAHTHRCKLHLPYLSRGFTDPTYSYSRTACIRAAQQVVQAEIELEEAGVSFAQIRLRSSGYLHSIFIASIALVTDICLRGMSAQPELGRGPTAQALGILKTARQYSNAADTLLESLSKALGTHGLLIGDIPDTQQSICMVPPTTAPSPSLSFPTDSPGWMRLAESSLNQEVFSPSDLFSFNFD